MSHIDGMQDIDLHYPNGEHRVTGRVLALYEWRLLHHMAAHHVMEQTPYPLPGRGYRVLPDMGLRGNAFDGFLCTHRGEVWPIKECQHCGVWHHNATRYRSCPHFDDGRDLPTTAQEQPVISADGRWQWDGSQWRPIVLEAYTNHAAHRIMCVLTLGAWLPVYGLVVWRNRRITKRRAAYWQR